MTLGLFWVFGGIAILSGFMCVTRRSPVASALWLVQTMFALAAMYVLLDAQFIAVMQILVYAGAIMVIFLFVIMLLNLGRSQSTDMVGMPGRITSLALGGLMAFELVVLSKVVPAEQFRLPEGTMAAMTDEMGAVGMIAEPLFRGYIVPFEITSVLLLAAVVGAVVLAKSKI